MPKTNVWPADRDRSILLCGAAGISALAWWHMAAIAAGMKAHHHVTQVGPLFLMWAVMMVAMMLPSTIPFVFAFSAEQRRRHRQRMTLVPAAYFVAGYFAVWTAFSGVCAVLQNLLHQRALLSPMMAATSSVLSGGILIAAGVYQFTPMKNACLRHCRSPLTFLLSEWREGPLGAVHMGAGHGLFCIGCCWMLMMLPFAAGVMNLVWMGGITVLLLLEKAAPGGPWIGRIGGALMVLAGVCAIAFSVA
ncbi:MAG TPA: DUF2182 domain-containing protein [Bryobacteraceae bacterium]|nr:DUF2182 domain-containing protein [Bryobacteraceae bacterium]